MRNSTQWLFDLRLLAALSLINVHVVYSISSFAKFDTGTLNWWISNLYLSSSIWGVPVFVMISGAILLSPDKTYDSHMDFYKRRLSKLGIPILFWSIFYLTPKHGYSEIDYTYIQSMFYAWLGGRPADHMWYVYMALGLYIVTPYLRSIVTYSTRFELQLLTVFLFAFSALGVLTESIDPHRATLFFQMFPHYLGYFFAGHLIITSTLQIKNRHLIFAIIFLIFVTLIGRYFLALELINYNFNSNFSLTIILISISIMFLIKNNYMKIKLDYTKRAYIAGFSLGAYLMHPAFIAIFDKFGFFDINMSTYLFIKIPLFTMFITVLSLFGAYIFSRVKYLNRTI